MHQGADAEWPPFVTRKFTFGDQIKKQHGRLERGRLRLQYNGPTWTYLQRCIAVLGVDTESVLFRTEQLVAYIMLQTKSGHHMKSVKLDRQQCRGKGEKKTRLCRNLRSIQSRQIKDELETSCAPSPVCIQASRSSVLRYCSPWFVRLKIVRSRLKTTNPLFYTGIKVQSAAAIVLAMDLRQQTKDRLAFSLIPLPVFSFQIDSINKFSTNNWRAATGAAHGPSC